MQNDKLPKKSKTPPIFDGEEPGKLLDWLEDLEDIWKSSGVTLDKAKIALALSWMKRATQKEMRKLASAKGDNWEAFKKELKDCYPECASSARGSKAKLESIVETHRIVPFGSLDKLLAYSRRFRLEAEKLLEAPALISDPEAVELYLRGLEERLQEEIYREVRRSPDDTTERRLEAPFTLKEILEAAEMVALKTAGRRIVRTTNSSTVVESRIMPSATRKEKSENMNEYENKLSKTIDQLNIANKSFVQTRELMVNQNKEILDVLNKIHQGGNVYRPANSYNNAARPSTNFSRTGKCYICDDPAHFVRDCKDFIQFMSDGWIFRNDQGRLCFKDGGLVPEGGLGKSRRDKIVEYAKSKGWTKKSESVNLTMECEDPEELLLQQEHCAMFSREHLPQTQNEMEQARTTTELESVVQRLENMEVMRTDDAQRLEKTEKVVQRFDSKLDMLLAGLQGQQSGN
ncbi:hypothetical protein VKT23_019984 [Stygiomarasmius scandens]